MAALGASEAVAPSGPRKAHARGVSFSAAGLLFPYHVGCAEALGEAGLLAGAMLGGCSAGAIVAALHLCEMPVDRQIALTKRIYQDLKDNGYWFRLAKSLRAILEEALPEDCAERCSGRMVVAMTEWRVLPRPPRARLVSEFESKEDLLDALIATTYTPLYAGPDMGVPFRQARWHSDGALTNFIAPTGASSEVVVVPTPWPFARTDITPLIRPGGMTYSWPQLVPMVFFPALYTDEVVDTLYENGRLDAEHWLESQQ